MAALADVPCSAIADLEEPPEMDHTATSRTRKSLTLPIPARVYRPPGSSSTPRLLGCPQNLTGAPLDMKPKKILEDTPSSSRTCHIDEARRLSVFSLIASLLVALLAISLGVSERTLSLVGFGGEQLLDGVSSAFVLWRFKQPKRTQTSGIGLSKRHARDAKRERNGSIGIGATFLLLACFLIFSAVAKFTWYHNSEQEHKGEERTAAIYSLVLVWFSATGFGGLAVLKFRLAEVLQSQVLQKDALCSALGALLGVIVGVTDVTVLAMQDDPESLAAVDPIAGLVIGVILFAEGCRTLWQNRHGETYEDEPQPFL